MHFAKTGMDMPNNYDKIVSFLQENPELTGVMAGALAGGTTAKLFRKSVLKGAGIGAAAGGALGYTSKALFNKIPDPLSLISTKDKVQAGYTETSKKDKIQTEGTQKADKESVNNTSADKGTEEVKDRVYLDEKPSSISHRDVMEHAIGKREAQNMLEQAAAYRRRNPHLQFNQDLSKVDARFPVYYRENLGGAAGTAASDAATWLYEDKGGVKRVSDVSIYKPAHINLLNTFKSSNPDDLDTVAHETAHHMQPFTPYRSLVGKEFREEAEINNALDDKASYVPKKYRDIVPFLDRDKSRLYPGIKNLSYGGVKEPAAVMSELKIQAEQAGYKLRKPEDVSSFINNLKSMDLWDKQNKPSIFYWLQKYLKENSDSETQPLRDFMIEQLPGIVRASGIRGKEQPA
jgi:hypothetical protein